MADVAGGQLGDCGQGLGGKGVTLVATTLKHDGKACYTSLFQLQLEVIRPIFWQP